MKLWVWSDAHLEISNSKIVFARPDADIIVIAGDLTYADRISEVAKDIIERYQMPIIYVAGNHEYYASHQRGSSLETDQLLLKLAERDSETWSHRFHVLDEDVVVIDGIRFVGATLWTDFKLNLTNESQLSARIRNSENLIRDFTSIRMRSGERFTAADMIALNASNARYIRDRLIEERDGKIVVVSHHLPHPACISERYQDSEANYLFSNSEDAFNDVLDSGTVDAWICGHSHQATDVVVGKTRVICNPQGYDFEREKNGFRSDLVVEI